MDAENQTQEKPKSESERRKAETSKEEAGLTPEVLSQQAADASKEVDSGVKYVEAYLGEIVGRVEERGGAMTPSETDEGKAIVTEAVVSGDRKKQEISSAADIHASESYSFGDDGGLILNNAENPADAGTSPDAGSSQKTGDTRTDLQKLRDQQEAAASASELESSDSGSKKTEADLGDVIPDVSVNAEIAAATDTRTDLQKLRDQQGASVDAAGAIPAAAESAAESKYSGMKGVKVSKEMRETVRQMRKEVNDSRDALIEAEEAMKQFEGAFGAGLFGGNKKEKTAAQAALESARERYEKARGEYVADNATRMLKERSAAEDARAEEVSQEKGLAGKAADFYRGLGKKNLDAAGWKPDSTVGKMVAKIASVRTGINMALAGGGFALGATAAGLPILAARRILAGVGAGIGSYDMAKAYADSKVGNFKAENVGKMEGDELISHMESMEARARINGVKVHEDAQYVSLRRELRDRISGRKESPADGEGADAGDYEEKKIAEIMKEADGDIKDATRARVLRDRAIKVAAVGVGLLAASGVAGQAVRGTIRGVGKLAHGAKELFGVHAASADALPSAPGEIGDAVPNATVHDASPADLKFDHDVTGDNMSHVSGDGTGVSVEHPAGAAHEATPGAVEVPADHGADIIQRGDGYVKIFARQMEGDPAKFGYDPAKHGADVHKWAMHEANGVAKAQGLMDKKLGFDAKHPMKITLNPDKTFTASGKVELEHRIPDGEVDARVKQIVAESKQEIKDADLDSYLKKPGEEVALPTDAERDAVIAHIKEVSPGTRSLTDTAMSGTKEVAVAHSADAASADAQPWEGHSIDNGQFTGDSARAHFRYDGDGKVVGATYEAQMSGTPDVLANGYEYNPGPGSLGEIDESMGLSAAEGDARRLGIEMQVYESMVRSGQGNSAEAKFLLKGIKDLAISTYRDAGPKFLKLHVFRDIDIWSKRAGR